MNQKGKMWSWGDYYAFHRWLTTQSHYCGGVRPSIWWMDDFSVSFCYLKREMYWILSVLCHGRMTFLYGQHQQAIQIQDWFVQWGDQKAGGGWDWGIYSFGSLPAGPWVGCVPASVKQASLHTYSLRILNHSLPFLVFILLLFLGLCTVDLSKLCLHLCKDSFY